MRLKELDRLVNYYVKKFALTGSFNINLNEQHYDQVDIYYVKTRVKHQILQMRAV